MADSSGVSSISGGSLSDWDHVQQSIDRILTTPIGSRVMRRDFGSTVPDLVDAKMTRATVLSLYSAAAEAIEAWEPRYRLRSASIVSASADGTIALTLVGVYFPRGHLGDYSVAEDATARILI
jgi:phage baseplate assembly protein W